MQVLQPFGQISPGIPVTLNASGLFEKPDGLVAGVYFCMRIRGKD